VGGENKTAIIKKITAVEIYKKRPDVFEKTKRQFFIYSL